MYIAYFYWHFVAAPMWLGKLFVNIEKVLLQFFSVKVLIKTLFSHWRRDSLSYQGKSLQTRFNIFVLNQISRVIGFIIRSITLLIWAVCQVFYLAIAASTFILFLTSPLVAVGLVVAGFTLMFI